MDACLFHGMSNYYLYLKKKHQLLLLSNYHSIVMRNINNLMSTMIANERTETFHSVIFVNYCVSSHHPPTIYRYYYNGHRSY